MSPIRSADPAATALDGAGSASVSCLLMEDTVAADAVSVGPGTGQVGLFANPYLGGRREALVVDGDGYLSYLRREESGTGWDQKRLSGAAGQLAATEVAVVVHPQYLDVWAVYNPRSGGTPRALRLDPPVADGAEGTWAEVPEAVLVRGGKTVNGLAHLNVYYQGRRPFISGIDAKTGLPVMIWPAVGYPNKVYFTCEVLDTTLSAAGAQDVLGGISDQQTSVWFARTGSKLMRWAPDTGRPITQVASDAAKLVGVFRSPDGGGMGCVYLDTGHPDTGKNLVTWQLAADGRETTTKTPGLGFWAATTWLDADGMMHVYGQVQDQGAAGHDTLMVLHQSGWSDNFATPVWSQVTPSPDATRTGTGIGTGAGTVAACVGLVRDVEYVDLDPFPGEDPALLVELAGQADDPERFSIHTLDRSAQRWTRDKIRLPLPQDATPKRVSRYVSTVTVRDRRGNPMPALPVSVSADALVEITVGGVGHLVGPGHAVQLITDPFGRVSMATVADSLLPATLRVDATGLEQGAIVQPAAAVHEYLAGTGTLPSQQGLFTGLALWDAKVDGAYIVDRSKHDETACDDTAAKTFQLFRAAAGEPLKSLRHTGSGPATAIHGFSLGSALAPDTGEGAGRVRYTEFATPEDLEAHLAAIRARPDYAGAWDDFTSWAGDVWEGIKNGVVTVKEITVGAVSTIILKIGEAVVTLTGLIVNTVEAAVRLTEAALSQVVEATAAVVDWLKALFEFEHIWNTAQALQSGFDLMVQHGTQTIQHYKTVGGAWFTDQEQNVARYFGGLKAGWAALQVGDPGNEMPALTDASGHALPEPSLRDNPQSTWMLDRAMASGIALAPLPPNPTLSGAWDAFVRNIEGGDLYRHFEAIQDDLATLLAQVTDPADPQQAVKASAVALLDILENLIQMALEALNAAFDTGVALVLDALAATGAILSAPLPDGPLNHLYRWIQGEAGVAADAVVDLSIGGLVFLIGGFAVTTAYKLVNGVDQQPFPDGKFPAVAGPVWGAGAEDGPGLGDPLDAATARRLKGAMGVVVASGSVFNAFADIAPAFEIPPAFKFTAWLVPTMNCLLGTTADLVLSHPGTSGKPFKGGAAGAFATSTLLAACAYGKLFTYAAAEPDERPYLTGAFKNFGDVFSPPAPAPPMTMPTVGPVVVTVLSVAKVLFTFADGEPVNAYNWGQLFMSATPGLTQWARWGVFKPDPSGRSKLQAGTVGAIDLVAGMTAGVMTACAGWKAALDITQQVVAQAKRGEPYRYVIERSGEFSFNTPLKWELFDGLLPGGLNLDSRTGIISGTPGMDSSTKDFSVRVTDSSAPPQIAQRTGFRIVVN